MLKALNTRQNPSISIESLFGLCKLVAIDVFKCLHSLSPEQFSNCFKRHQHGKNTRGNNSGLVLPPIRTETGKRTLTFQGAKILNKLPKDNRDEESLVRFKHRLSLHGF